MPKSKKTAKPASSTSTPAISTPSLRIEIDEALLRRFRSLPSEERHLLGQALNQAAVAWGHPHLHAGSGIRKLTGSHFECRSGLRTRLLFKVLPDGGLYFHFIGIHDEIRQFLKAHR